MATDVPYKITYVVNIELADLERQITLNHLKKVNFVYHCLYKNQFWTNQDWVSMVQIFTDDLRKRGYSYTEEISHKNSHLVLRIGKQTSEPYEDQAVLEIKKTSGYV